ncbi:hypothetical protein DUNSADRAFT_7637 [Dunaliella salina]|uniref:Uncharacterized protein n=1 Tax=Dunaliella salina TaxID=3046 RepID=A0ABQ7GKZ7_DUNSA|nr:hypothetical protein DUNSADRAFT_7637 [Dunaliella salina]|eukprot:KAF5835275.1 hypothetical protein DUNSADRAFT_7637 [Dunaliella salina]
MDSKAHQGQAFAGMTGSLGPNDPMREIIVLAACGAHEVLPQNPELPADVFTACLTTPIKVALRWFCSRSLLRHDGITKDLIDQIPGRQTDRKTPLGELNWIFTAITDTIAWNVLPKPLFQKLFRSDLLVASLFRNFLLAERIMTAANCNPVSYPRLPPTHNHPMWQVLLSQVHRLRALVLLGRFLDMGPWAVDLALSVGIFPYVLKLLQTISVDLRPTLVFIWCKILALDLSCQADLVKDNGHSYFIKYLDSLVVVDGAADLNSRAQAAFVLSAVCDSHPKGQALCASGNLLATLLKWLRFMFPPCVVYDPSVLVRCELAVLYARFVRGHAPRMQEVLATQQQRLADFARQHAVQPPSLPFSSLSAPPMHQSSAGAVHNGSQGTMEGTRRGSMESGYEGRRMQGSRGPPTSSVSTSNLEQRTGLPGMGATSPPSVPPTDQLPSGESPRGGVAGGVPGAEEAAAAAGAAARPFTGPNEGLSAQQQQALATYSALLESIQMLALDPSPKVAKLGRQVLRIAGCELQFVEIAPPGMSASNGGVQGSSGAVLGTNGPSSPHHPSNTLVALKQKVLHPRTWARPSGSVSANVPTVGAPTSADRSNSSATSGGSAAEGLQPIATSGVAGGGVSMLSTPSNPRGFFMQPPQPPPAHTVTLPQSPIYKMSSEAFSRPLLEPMATAWRDTEGSIATPWTGPVDPGRRAFRLREIETSMARCRLITTPKLREQVYSIEHGSSDGLTAVTFHPYHPLLICADTRGNIKVSNFQDSTLANAFHVASGTCLNDPRQMSAHVTFLQQLNEADGPMLLTGCSDGTVRVWRNYTLPGGCHPDMVYCWDLQQEVCSSLIRTSTPGSLPVSVDRILLGAYSAGSSASCMHPALLVAACSDATLRLYDVRTGNAGPAMMLQPFRQPPAGVAVEPAGKPSIIAAASERGELRMMDLRMVPNLPANVGAPGLEAVNLHQGSSAYDAALDCALKSVPAHSKGGVSALVAHAHAPLMATGTKSQVVKVWTDECDVVGAIRPQSAFLSHQAGPVTCMAWHPYQPLLAAGCSDSTATVYAIDQSVGPGSFSMKQHNPNPSSGSNSNRERGSLVRTSWS